MRLIISYCKRCNDILDHSAVFRLMKKHQEYLTKPEKGYELIILALRL